VSISLCPAVGSLRHSFRSLRERRTCRIRDCVGVFTTPAGVVLSRSDRGLDRPSTPPRPGQPYASRLGSHSVSLHTLPQTAVRDAIGKEARIHQGRDSADHSVVRTTQEYFVSEQADGPWTGRCIWI
jgi:hypothetical protein